ncbi:MAG: M36 family metallopeptidase [Candidatus Ozemobacteraceae bacterium]
MKRNFAMGLVKRVGLMGLVISQMALSGAFALEFSPTQIELPMRTMQTAAQPREKVLDAVLADPLISCNADTITFSADGEQIRSLRGELSAPLSGDLVEAAKSYLIAHSSMFNLPTGRDVTSLKLVRNDLNAGVTHLGFQMNLSGFNVFEARIDVHIGSDRTITMITGSFPTISEISNSWVLSPDAAAEKAMQNIGVKSLRSTRSIEPIIFAADGKARVGHLVRLPSADPLGDFELIIDAENGDCLYKINQMQFMSGRGSVYQLDPLKSAVTNEELPNITGNTPTGVFANVVNEDGSSAVSATREFVFDPQNTHFDEINVYYHINRIHDFFKGFGHNKMDRSLKVVVHYGTALDRAFFSPQDDMIALGDGTKLNDLSKDNTVIYHEYSHATLRSILSLMQSGEAGAINEGQADYFACTLSDDPKVGQWAASKKPGNYLRKIDNILHYPEALVYEVHADGRIWGGVCWDLRKTLGAAVVDQLVHRSLYYLKPQETTFFDGYQAILAADKECNGSANSATITKVFETRGIAKARNNGPVLERSDLQVLRTFKAVHDLKAIHGVSK